MFSNFGDLASGPWLRRLRPCWNANQQRVEVMLGSTWKQLPASLTILCDGAIILRGMRALIMRALKGIRGLSWVLWLALLLPLLLACVSDAAAPTPVAAIPVVGASPTVTPTEADRFTQAREDMVLQQIMGRGVTDENVLAAMRAVPRHLFVPEEFLDQAYADHPLPIGHGQTISQPYIVALMSEALALHPGQRVLEIGTGSAYQAAVLAEMGMEVYTVEIIPELAAAAEARLDNLGYSKVKTRSADGYYGWEDYAPFDAIMVTAAPDHLPQPLASQLKEGGRLVIPIGPVGAFQTLWLFEKKGGELQAQNLGGVSFVPLTGEH